MTTRKKATISVRKQILEEIRVIAASKGKLPGVYATEILQSHIQKVHRTRMKATA